MLLKNWARFSCENQEHTAKFSKLVWISKIFPKSFASTPLLLCIFRLPKPITNRMSRVQFMLYSLQSLLPPCLSGEGWLGLNKVPPRRRRLPVIARTMSKAGLRLLDNTMASSRAAAEVETQRFPDKICGQSQDFDRKFCLLYL